MNDDPVMLITGTSRGLGAHLARHYSAAGYRVVGCSRSDAPAPPGGAHYVVDIQSDAQVRGMFGDIRQKYGRLDVLINNSALSMWAQALLSPPSTIESIFRTNVFGAITCCVEAVKIMMRRRFGRIVTLSSIAVPGATAGTSAYGSSKAAIEQFSRVLAHEVAASGISVNVARLSLVERIGMAASVGSDAEELILNHSVRAIRIAPEDVMTVLDFLVSIQSGAVTGQIIEVA